MVNSKMLAKMLDSAEKHVFINIDGKMARISHIRFVNDGESFVLCAGDTSEADWKTPENIRAYFSSTSFAINLVYLNNFHTITPLL